MTKQNKQLLLKDLSARVLYRPKVKILHVWNEEKEIEEDIVDTVHCVLPEGYINTETIDSDIPLNGNIVLYLRPMSSMTEEEREEIRQQFCYEWDEESVPELMYYFIKIKDTDYFMDWLNAHHFDYRGLIEKGLALEAPEGMYD